MGIDACIFVKLKSGSRLTYIEYHLSHVNHPNIDATHEVNIVERYYDENGGKGYWPDIFKTLAACFKDPEVLKVFYLSDSYFPNDHDVENGIEVQPITPERVSEICLRYLKEKDRKI
jgi:hypothetical protein